MGQTRIEKIVEVYNSTKDKEVSTACEEFFFAHNELHKGKATVEEVLALEKKVLELVSLKEKAMYLIWSIEHTAWWRPHGTGYTPKRSEAGLYSFEEAEKIVESANIGLHDTPNEAIIKYK